MIRLEPNDDSDEFSPFDITPLVDIVFLLLIFFLLTASFTYPTMHLKLPQSRSAKAGLHRPDYTISILRDGEILVNNRPASIGTLGKIPPNSSEIFIEYNYFKGKPDFSFFLLFSGSEVMVFN